MARKYLMKAEQRGTMWQTLDAWTSKLRAMHEDLRKVLLKIGRWVGLLVRSRESLLGGYGCMWQFRMSTHVS
jgi:hypothetical protein